MLVAGGVLEDEAIPFALLTLMGSMSGQDLPLMAQVSNLESF